MKVYQLKRSQVLPITLQHAWEFFSSPKNLAKITPEQMGFNILSISGGDKMYAGQIINYKIKILPFYRARWTTEITHVQEPFYFVDEQRFGPYALWNHQNHFKEVTGGVEVKYDVHYAIPFGFLGRLANAVFVQRELNTIFEYRNAILQKYFPSGDKTVLKSA